MNKIELLGRLTRDPEIRYSQGANSIPIANVSIAVNRKFKRENEADADFFNCIAFNKIAEVIERYCTKGKQVAIVGHLQNNHYTNKDGVKMYQEVIVIDELDFCGSKSDSAADGKRPNSDEFMNIPDGIDEELPFN